MYTLIEYLPYTSLLIAAMFGALVMSLFEWNQTRRANKKQLTELIAPAPESETLPVSDFETKQTQERIKRLMKIHAITEAKAIELQKVIDQEWLEVTEKAQKAVDDEHSKILNKLK